MAAPHQVIYGLPLLRWRGLEWPFFSGGGYSFSNLYAKHQYYEAPATHHQYTGKGSKSISIRLIFLNTLREKSFPDEWERWQRALERPGSGKLVHPVLGEVDAVCNGGSVVITETSTAGVSVDVTWTTNLLDPAKTPRQNAVKVDVEALAIQADGLMRELGIEVPNQQTNLPETAGAPIPSPAAQIASQDGVTSIAAMTQYVNTFRFEANVQMVGPIVQAMGIVSGVINTANRFDDHRAYPLIDTLTQLWEGFDSIRRAADNARPTRTVLTDRRMTIRQIIEQYGEEKNEEREIIELNPDVLVSPVVPAQSKITLYR